MRGTSTNVSVPATGAAERRLTTLWNVVSPGYFEALGLPIVRGRAFTDTDGAGSAGVAIVSETFARRAWPGEDAIGRVLVDGDGQRTMQVVGVARDSKYRSIGEAPQPFLYRPLGQEHESELAILIRRSGPSIIPAVRALLQQMDPNLPIVRATTDLRPRRSVCFPDALPGGPLRARGSSVCFWQASVCTESRRTKSPAVRERSALDSRWVRLRREFFAWSSAGQCNWQVRVALLGLLAAAGISQLLTIGLSGVKPLDPISFVSGVALFPVVALAASLIPARRAAAADPVAALRAE